MVQLLLFWFFLLMFVVCLGGVLRAVWLRRYDRLFGLFVLGMVLAGINVWLRLPATSGAAA